MSKHSKTRAVNIEAVDKRKHVVELRRAGHGWDEVAKQAGYASRGAAYTAFTLALKEVVREPTRELVELELQRLDALFLAMWELAKQGDYQATDRAIRIMERRAKLLGLDAPERIEVEESDRLKLSALRALCSSKELFGAVLTAGSLLPLFTRFVREMAVVDGEQHYAALTTSGEAAAE
jgi:hypothetical protein